MPTRGTPREPETLRRLDGGPRPAGQGLRRLLGWLTVVGALAGPGCRDQAPAEGYPFALPRAPKAAAAGPWFVDKAHDFGLDVVTRCGSPDKTSVLDSLGTGVALFDIDGDGDLDIFVAAGSEVRNGKVACAGGPWLFRNDGPGCWVDASERSGLRHTGWRKARPSATTTATATSISSSAATRPRHALAKPGERYVPRRDEGRRHFRQRMGCFRHLGDYDDDGWPDLYVANYLDVLLRFAPPRTDPTILRGRHDGFSRARVSGRPARPPLGATRGTGSSRMSPGRPASLIPRVRDARPSSQTSMATGSSTSM